MELQQETKRKLASIQLISGLRSIEGADKIECAQIEGWEVCVKKGEFKVGDPCIMCVIDSVLPDHPEFDFLRSRGFRIKTIRLKKQISQGIAFPLSILPKEKFEEMSKANPQDLVGVDVTEMLGVLKWSPEIPAQLRGQIKGLFPSFLVKTDEERIQTCHGILYRHMGKQFYISEKVDGTSCTFYLKDGVFGVCSRNLDLKEDENTTYWKMARELDIENKLKTLNGNYALQGELVGNGIQNNKYKLPNVQFFVFNVYDIDKSKYLDFKDFINIAKTLGLQSVPILNENWILPDRCPDALVPELVEMSKGVSVLNKETLREGIVFRSVIEDRDEHLGRLSFKTINPLFLLKFDA